MLLLCQMRDIDSMSRGGVPWPQTGATQYRAQLGLKNGLALGCYQPSPEVLYKTRFLETDIQMDIIILFYNNTILFSL